MLRLPAYGEHSSMQAFEEENQAGVLVRTLNLAN
jgi:hypothetical protein